MRRCSLWAGLALEVGLCLSATGQSINSGQVDDFPANDTLGWTMGLNSTMFPSVVDSGGPQGASDPYLQVVSTGTGKANSKMIVFNQQQWTGNYIAAGVTQITAELCDFGPNPLYMRVAIQDDFGSWYASAVADPLPADSQWHPVTFDLTASGMNLISGASTYTHAMSNVGLLRILSHQSDTWPVGTQAGSGDTVAATLGIDNIAAVPEPSAILLMLGALGLLPFRHRPHLSS